MLDRKLAVALVSLIAGLTLSGCGTSEQPVSSLADGKYAGQSEPESDGSYGTVSFTIKDGKVSDARFVIRDKDGTPHDKNYGLGSSGKPADPAFYQRAQNAIAAEQQYVKEFTETGDQVNIKAVAGGTLSYRLFRSAVEEAIKNAQS